MCFQGFLGSQPGEFRQGGTSQSRWRLHYAEWDSRCQWNAAKQIYVLTNMLRIFQKEALADSKISWISWNEEITWIQHTWVIILSSFRDKGTTPGEPKPFALGTTRCFMAGSWWLQVQFQAKFCWLQVGQSQGKNGSAGFLKVKVFDTVDGSEIRLTTLDV